MKKFIFVLLCLAVSSVSIFGQTLDTDLKNYFNKHSLIKIDDQEALRKAKNQVPFSFKVGDKRIQFILRPNEIRSERYKAQYTNASGVFSLPKSEIFTYTGTLIGERDSVLAFTVDGRITEGFFLIGQEEYYLESAKKYSSRANNDDKVVYQRKDRIRRNELIFELDKAIAMQLDKTDASAMNALMSSPTTWSGIKVIELATEADYQWVTKPQFAGNPQSANDYIISVLNGVDVLYRRYLKLTVSVVFQNAWTSPDPYSAVNKEVTLNEFKARWNSIYPYNHSAYKRDLAHLFTGKYSNTGIATLGIACINPSSGYGLSGYVDNPQNQLYIRDAQIVMAAHEIGHNLGADHVNDSGDCASTVMNPNTSNLSLRFCSASITEITNFITNNINNGYDCLATELIELARRTPFDFEVDGKADISIFRPSQGLWCFQLSTAGYTCTQFGTSTDKLVPADYDGDGKTDIAIFRNGIWAIDRSSRGYIERNWGTAGDIPVPGDFNGDRNAELVVFRPSNGTWYIYNLVSDLYRAEQFGTNGDKPLIGDFDNDDKNDLAVFRAGNWYIQLSENNTFFAQSFGLPTDKPVPADYDGDGKTDIAVYRDGIWYLQRSTAGFIAYDLGTSTDIPTPADYDGDGKADISIFRPSTGYWYRYNSSTNEFIGIYFGTSEDIPVPAFNIVQ